jgi:apolipoprotein N-acyltransferase
MISRFLAALSWPRTLLLAFILGALNVLAFAPFSFWPLQILSLAGVVLLAQQGQALSLKRQAILGWCYGFSWLGFGFAWLTIALARYGGLPWFLAVCAIALLAGSLALFMGFAFIVMAYLQHRWQLSRGSAFLLVFPVCVTLAEWLRGWVFTGFPWLTSGYVHTESWLAAYAPVFGVYGLSWLNALLAAGVAYAVLDTKKRVQLAVLIVGIFLAGLGLKQVKWTHPQGQEISVRLLQGNIDQGIKFDAEHLIATLSLYREMITAEPADLIATPETAFPILTTQLPENYLEQFKQFTQTSQSHLLLGVVAHDGGERYANSAFGFGENYRNGTYRYDKHHLVPFGEFIPLGFRWFTDMLQIPLSDLTSAGLHQPPMKVKDQWVLPNICYEDVFGEEIAAQLLAQHKSGAPMASVLINMSNLAWYGNSTAIPQHLQISRMRVLETGRPMLRSTNTGATALITSGGDVLVQLATGTRGSLRVKVQGVQGITPYILWGNRGILVLLGLSLLCAYGLARISNKRVSS